MIGVYVRNEGGNENYIFVRGCFSVYQKNKCLDINYSLDFLENLNLEFIADCNSGEVEDEIEDGICRKIKVRDSFLRHINNLVIGKQDEKIKKEITGFYQNILKSFLKWESDTR